MRKKELQELEPVKENRRVDVRIDSFMFRGKVHRAKFDPIKKVHFFELDNDGDDFAKQVLRKAL
jgi:hypothetical protein